ncbi:unnamed protein product [Mytilus coruscus]|uniref:Reverse transcriptase domain-containing protein n=1 Tax=Mytilus coruscus TaxID=42192 RepID=A0A6J8ANL2_MYTCO|nr:unnamed protein product [Mytilus coruscus]
MTLEGSSSKTMTDDEWVLTWANAKKLSEATANAVISLGFDSMEALSWQDPQIFIKSLGNDKGNSNHLAIVDFVMLSEVNSGDNDERIVSESGAGQLIFKSGPFKPKLESLNQRFDIVTSAANELPSGIVGKNHPSASPNSPLYEKAHLQILNEIECGNYVFAEKTPRIISPLAVIPKPDGVVRIIHDISRPEGSAINSCGGMEKQRFQTLDEASKLATPNCYMAKVDLKIAYRSVKLSSQSQEVTGLRWTFPDGTEYTFYDTKLPFGSKFAHHIFHRLSQAVRRMMSRRGFTIIAYLDDFFICETTKQRCIHALNILLALICKLGFMINWSKVVDPTTKLTFIGIEIDSIAMELRLQGEKLSFLKHELAEFSNQNRASKKQLQSIAGKLNWASAVVHGDRVFLRRIIDAITPLKHNWHKAILHGETWHDIEWWKKILETFNGKSLIF